MKTETKNLPPQARQSALPRDLAGDVDEDRFLVETFLAIWGLLVAIWHAGVRNMREIGGLALALLAVPSCLYVIAASYRAATFLSGNAVGLQFTPWLDMPWTVIHKLVDWVSSLF